MSTIVQLKPTSSLLNSKWAVTGAANVWTALADGSDASYCQASVDKAALAVALNLGVIPAGKTLNRWRLRVKDSRPVAPGTFTAQCIWWNTSGGTTAVFGQATFSGLRSLITWDNGGWVAAATADPFASIPANTKPALWLASLTDLTSSVVPVEALIEAEYLTPPAVTAVTPSGTVADTNYPTVSWTYTSNESLGQTVAEVKIYPQAVYSAAGFNPATSPGAIWSTTVGVASSVTVSTPLPITGTYRVYVHAGESTGYVTSYADWSYGEFTMAVAGAPPVPDLSGSYSQATNSVTLNTQGHQNLLTLEQSSLEGGTTTGWTAGANCSITNSTTQAAVGTHSLRLSSTASGDMNAYTLSGTSGVRVTAGEAYTAMASFRAGASARSVRVDITWYDAAGATLGTTTGSAVTDSTSGWTVATNPASAVANAAYASVRAYVVGTGGASELHYVDKVALYPGSASSWSLGGSAGVSAIRLERSNDGGVTWLQVRRWPGSDVEVNTGVAVDSAVQKYATTDYEAARPGTVQYRARSIHAYLGGATLIGSEWTTPVMVTTTSDGKVWVKAVANPALNAAVRVRRGSVDGTTEEDLGVFRPLGRLGAVVVHGDLHGEDGDALTLMATGATEYATVKALAYHQGVLLVQHIELDENGRGRQWWISAAAGRQRHDLDNPVHKEITFPFVDCGPGAG